MTTSKTLDVPGARLHYEVRGSGPVLMLIGAPMEGGWFADLAALLADGYTVVTYDPRGVAGSTRDDPHQDATPELLADDVHRVLAAVTAEPAYLFGSSGGAVTGLALVARHPDQVRTLVAHEPPLCELLPDSARVRAAIDDMYDTYLSAGRDAAMAKFYALAGIDDDSFSPPEDEPNEAPEQSTPDDGDDYFFAHMVRPVTRYRPDISALRAGPTRIVVAGGTTSRGELAHRCAVALAEQLDTPLVDFPSDHAGFMAEPEPFAHVLREVLTGR